MKLTIKGICKKFELSEVYVRRMIQHGKLQTTKELVPGTTNIFRHVVDEEEVIRWRKNTVSRGSKRSDGRTKYNLYGNLEEIEKIKKLLQENGIESPVIRSNPPKTEVE